MKHSRLFLYLIVLVLTLSSHPGKTDITPMDYSPPPTGGGVSPKSPHPTIRLDDQEVIIRLKQATYTVDAVFHLSNKGETTTEWIGFPKNAMGPRRGPVDKVMDFIRFEVSVNGENTPFGEASDFIKGAQSTPEKPRLWSAEHSSWLVGQAVLPGHAITTIRLSYETSYNSGGRAGHEAFYIYGTGGYWKDSIGKATFIVDSAQRGGVDRAEAVFSTSEATRYMIHRWLISEYVAKYEIRDFEPHPQGALTFKFFSRGSGKDGHINELIHAAMNGRLEQAQALLKKGVDVNSKDLSGETPLMRAAWGGHLQVAKLLLEKGADVNAETKTGKTALQAALSNAWMGRGQLEVAKFLKDNGAKSTTLAVAAFVGDMEAVERLAAGGVNVQEKPKIDNPSPLLAASMGGQCEVVKFLLDKGLKIDAKNEQGQTALMAAATANQAEVLKVLLDRGANINERDVHRRSVLNHAVWLRGNAEAARVLLDRGADINARDDPANRTPLMHAAQSGHLEVVKLLVEKGADVSARDACGDTALSLARGKDIEEIDEVLKAHGATK